MVTVTTIYDLGILGDWYEDQGENGELIRNLYVFNMWGGIYWLNSLYLIVRHENFIGNGYQYGYSEFFGNDGYGKGLGYLWCERGLTRGNNFMICCEFPGYPGHYNLIQ